MIVGMLLKNYKVYGGLNYIPVTINHKFTAYIGDNGVGKSSILEALDTYFNNRDWNTTSGESLTDANTPYVVIMHLLEKNKIDLILKKDFKKKNIDYFRNISDFLWGFDDLLKELPSKSSEAKKMIEELKNIDFDYNETHYLMISGSGYSSSDIFFGSFDSLIYKKFIENKEEITFDSQSENKNKNFRKEFSFINNCIREYYSYVYIPVEINVEDFTKLETKNMQRLMGKDINEAIEEIITKDNLTNINKKLKEFINTVEENLKLYTYKNSNRVNITMNELTQKVIELFFSIRVLHKKVDNKNIKSENLSSGEKRQAFIDVSAALIKSQDIDDKELVLAIDEPEASLNVSKNYTQFEKIIDLAVSNKTQVLITTHWYGFLPITTAGNIHCISIKAKEAGKNEFQFNTFDLYNYQEKINQIKSSNYKNLPDDISLKSINDLIQSIISSLKTKPCYSWLICEGSSDKIYLEYYLNDLINNINLRILPVGGAKNVIRIYNYLVNPLQEKLDIKGRVYCLIDTDSELPNFVKNESLSSASILSAKRLANKNDKTNLVDICSNGFLEETDIENCLDGKTFVESLHSFEDENINNLLDDSNNIKDLNLNSYFCFNLRTDDKKIIKDFFDMDKNKDIKVKFAKKYVEIANSEGENHRIPEWISEIKNWFLG